MKRLGHTLTIGILVAILTAVASPAVAAVTCSLSSGTLSVSITGGGSENLDLTEEADGEFTLTTFSGAVNCTGGPPTNANTDLIEVIDSSVTGSDTTLTLWGLPFLDGGGVEVDVKLDMGPGQDHVRFYALGGPVNFRLGSLGVNTNADETTPDLDIDVSDIADLENVDAAGSDSADVISGAGNAGTGTAFPKPLRIDALNGADQIRGGAGQNLLFGYAGDDTIDCGGSIVDILDYAFGPPVRVDLAAGTATGDGTDTILGACENVQGSDGPDVLRGTTGTQGLFGRLGRDVLEGRGGDDILAGNNCSDESAADTVTYASAPDGVSVDLVAESGGSTMTGNDLYCDIDNVIGGEHADTLLGDGTPNVLTGGGNDDILNGRGGSDTASYASNPTPIQADLGAGTVLGASTDTLSSIERIIGTLFADTVEGNGAANRFWGRGAADRLVGLAGRDQLDGGTGGDDLLAGPGNDRLTGRAGPDLLNGGPHIDLCKGGPGSDTRRRCERGRG